MTKSDLPVNTGSSSGSGGWRRDASLVSGSCICFVSVLWAEGNQSVDLDPSNTHLAIECSGHSSSPFVEDRAQFTGPFTACISPRGVRKQVTMAVIDYIRSH